MSRSGQGNYQQPGDIGGIRSLMINGREGRVSREGVEGQKKMPVAKKCPSLSDPVNLWLDLLV